MITQQMISGDISEAYGDKPPEQQAAAQTAYSLGVDWVNSQPKTWCMSDERKSKIEQRREARIKKREVSAQLYNHIYNQMVPQQTQSVDGIQVVGFGFIALAILSAIISWVVQKLLSRYFA